MSLVSRIVPIGPAFAEVRPSTAIAFSVKPQGAPPETGGSQPAESVPEWQPAHNAANAPQESNPWSSDAGGLGGY